MNSLAKKVTLLQVVIVTLSMFAFIFYSTFAHKTKLFFSVSTDNSNNLA